MKTSMNMPTILGVLTIISSVTAPILYVGGIKEVNAVQQVKIDTHEKELQEFKSEIKDLNAKIDAILWKNGINPETVVSLSTNK